MCGIVAQYGEPSEPVLERMLERITHRGPDDHGSIRVNGAWLGHRRLSIVDVGGGRQPLHDGDGAFFLVGNGEIYNHVDVRARLDGRIFSTDSDTEVAVHLIDELGPAALHQLNGMYAFCAAGHDGRFVAARDPVGIKPLYWAKSTGSHAGLPHKVLFASEMHAFEPEWLPQVEVFPPGHYWTPEEGLVRFAEAIPGAQAELIEGPTEPGAEIPQPILDQTREILVRCVRDQMMGDVPVGVFLSGGLDSSLVAAIAAEYMREQGMRLQTFAVGVEGSPDIVAARVVAEHLGTDHHERLYDADEAMAILPDVVRSIESFDPALVRSAVPNYLVAELAAEHVKVVLTGEGADELFAGYEYFREFTDPDELHDELVRTVQGLHNLNLQRCDRVTMAHSLEARVPFLDPRVIEWALRLPPGWKLASEDQQEKMLLRQAFTGWLPDEFLFRDKAQFGDGSGAASVLTDVLESRISDEQFADERHAITPPLRTKEELHYHRIFAEHLLGLRAEDNIGRFATA